MAPTVSIIVPVYNAEKTIGRCIDSILGQQYTDFELLLVDDGSKDGSGAICDSYALADSRVQVIHKENTGVSDTRNIGISRARGVYLQFLDSDDWITPDATKLLVEAAGEHNCDLVISDFYRVVGERVSRKGDIAKGNDQKVGGNGVLIEVYYDDVANTAKVVEINTYGGEVTSARAKTASKDANVTVTPLNAGKGGNYETEDFKVDDIVAYNYSTKTSDAGVKNGDYLYYIQRGRLLRRLPAN